MRTLCVSAITLAMLAGSSVGVAAPVEDATSRPPIPSAGCGSSEIEPGIHRSLSMEIDGDERQWAMYVPEAHDGTTTSPLWVQLHGLGGSASGEIRQVVGVADEHGIVVVAPQGTFGDAAWSWRASDTELDLTPTNPDIALVGALIDQLGEELCLDLARVYLAGYSAGGLGVSAIACVLEDRIAAVAGVAGLYDPGDGCVLDRPVPLLAIHGRADSTNLFDGGLGAGTAGLMLGGVPLAEHPIVKAHEFTSMPTRATGIAVRNGCEPEPLIENIDDAWERWSWTCPIRADVELLVHGGGHSRGHSGATDKIWEFFEQRPMPE